MYRTSIVFHCYRHYEDFIQKRLVAFLKKGPGCFPSYRGERGVVLAEAFWPPHNPDLRQNDAFWSPQLYLNLLLPLCVGVSPRLFSVCVLGVCTSSLFVYLQTDRLRFDQVRAPGATHRWPSSIVVCAQTHTQHSQQLIHAHIREAEWDDVRAAKSLMAATFSVFGFQTAAIRLHHNAREQAQERLADDGLTLQTRASLNGLMGKNRGGLCFSFPLDFERDPAPPYSTLSLVCYGAQLFSFSVPEKNETGTWRDFKVWKLAAQMARLWPSPAGQQADGIQVVGLRVNGVEVEGVVGTTKWQVTSPLRSNPFRTGVKWFSFGRLNRLFSEPAESCRPAAPSTRLRGSRGPRLSPHHLEYSPIIPSSYSIHCISLWDADVSFIPPVGWCKNDFASR